MAQNLMGEDTMIGIFSKVIFTCLIFTSYFFAVPTFECINLLVWWMHYEIKYILCGYAVCNICYTQFYIQNNV